MKCYMFASDKGKPTITFGVQSFLLAGISKSSNIYVSSEMKEQLKEKTIYELGFVQDKKFPSCYEAVVPEKDEIGGFVVVTSKTVEFTDNLFFGVSGVTVVSHVTDDGDADTTMHVTGMTPEEFEAKFKDVKFFYNH